MGKHYVTMTAIIVIGVIEGLAIMKGINGVILSSTIGVVAGLAGFVVGKNKKERGYDHATEQTAVGRDQGEPGQRGCGG